MKTAIRLKEIHQVTVAHEQMRRISVYLGISGTGMRNLTFNKHGDTFLPFLVDSGVQFKFSTHWAFQGPKCDSYHSAHWKAQ